MRHLLCATLAAALTACSSADPVTAADVRDYTGLSICQGASVRDLTSPQERNTTPGFSFHVALQLSPGCEASFRKQLAALPTSSCNASGCTVEDAYPNAGKHTSITVRSLGSGSFDMRFYE